MKPYFRRLWCRRFPALTSPSEDPWRSFVKRVEKCGCEGPRSKQTTWEKHGGVWKRNRTASSAFPTGTGGIKPPHLLRLQSSSISSGTNRFCSHQNGQTPSLRQFWIPAVIRSPPVCHHSCCCLLLLLLRRSFVSRFRTFPPFLPKCFTFAYIPSNNGHI